MKSRNRAEIMRLAAEIISDLSSGEMKDAEVYRFIIRDAAKIIELAAERANEIDEDLADKQPGELIEMVRRVL